MDRLLEIREKIEETSAMISRSEQAIKKDPQLASVLIAAQSFRDRQAKLERQFFDEAANIGIEVMSYRLFSEGQPKLAGVASALGDFQALVTLAYDAEKNGQRKMTAKVASESVAESSFDFAYTFPGSIGVVLTIRDELLLVGETNLDRSIGDIFMMAKTAEPAGIQEYAKRLGPAVVRMLYRWASHHAQFELGADIVWRRGDEVRSKLFIQPPELVRLQETIDRVSEELSEDIVETARLEGADVGSRTFHLKLDDGQDIRGRFHDAIGEKHQASIPARYRATLNKTTTIRYSTEEESAVYFLSKLESPL
jgi:hypothetical protein